MRTWLFLWGMSLAVPGAFAQCGDPAINPTDSTASVQRKLTCYSEELARVKQQLAQVQADLDQATSAAASVRAYVQVYERPFIFRPFISRLDTCKSRAVDALAKRGGTFVTQDSEWLNFNTPKGMVVINCNLNRQDIGAVTVGDLDDSQATKWAKAIWTEVFY